MVNITIIDYYIPSGNFFTPGRIIKFKGGAKTVKIVLKNRYDELKIRNFNMKTVMSNFIRVSRIFERVRSIKSCKME